MLPVALSQVCVVPYEPAEPEMAKCSSCVGCNDTRLTAPPNVLLPSLSLGPKPSVTLMLLKAGTANCDRSRSPVLPSLSTCPSSVTSDSDGSGPRNDTTAGAVGAPESGCWIITEGTCCR